MILEWEQSTYERTVERRMYPIIMKAPPTDIREEARRSSEDAGINTDESCLRLLFTVLKNSYNGTTGQRRALWEEIQRVPKCTSLSEARRNMRKWMNSVRVCEGMHITIDAGMLVSCVSQMVSGYEKCDQEFRAYREHHCRQNSTRRTQVTEYKKFWAYARAVAGMLDVTHGDEAIFATIKEITGPIKEPDPKPMDNPTIRAIRTGDCENFSLGECTFGSTCSKTHQRPFPFKGCFECGGPGHGCILCCPR